MSDDDDLPSDGDLEIVPDSVPDDVDEHGIVSDVLALALVVCPLVAHGLGFVTLSDGMVTTLLFLAMAILGYDDLIKVRKS